MFDTTHKSDSKNIGIVKYNYPENVLYPNYKKTPEKDKCIELPFLGNPSYPNLTLGNTIYNTTKIYVYGKLHQIKDLDYDGELVIEHSAITNWGGKVYTCIPLKTTTGIADTTIDAIISMTNKVSAISFNQLLQQSANTRAIIYNDTGFFTSSNTVMVLLKPVQVRASFAHFLSNSDLFACSTSNYDVVHVIQDNHSQSLENTTHIYEKRIEGFKEGVDGEKCQKMPEALPDSDVYISCKPSDVSTEDVQALNMPLTSDMINDNEHLKMMKNMMALFTVLFIFGVVSFFVPMLYQFIVIGEILNYYLRQESLNPDQKKKKIYGRLSTMDIVISIAILSLSFGLISDGVNTSSPIEKSVGMLVGGLYVLGWFMVTNARLTPGYFSGILDKIPGFVKTTGVEDVPSIENADLISLLRDTIDLLSKNVSAFMGFVVLIVIIAWPMYYSSDHPTYAWFFASYASLFSVYFIYLIDQYYKSFENPGSPLVPGAPPKPPAPPKP